MSFPVAAGYRNMGSAAMRYIPVLYAGKLLVKFYDKTILSLITNTEYEGQIRQYGDTVVIRSRPNMIIRTWRKGQTLVNDQPEATSQELLIDKAFYWSFVTDDLDDIQTDIKSFINEWTDDASNNLRIEIDTNVLQNMYSGVSAYNTGITAGYRSGDINLGSAAAPYVLDKTNILDILVDAGTCLDELNIPDDHRYFCLPPKAMGLIKKSELRDASFSGDPKTLLRMGVVGMLDRFNLISTNLLNSTAGVYNMVFGHPLATTFATQLTKNKVQDNPNGFGMLHRGLNVFGWKVTKEEGLGQVVGSIA